MPAARRRSPKRRDLEPNLYEYNGYYKYRHPQTKKMHGMGSNKAKANAAARKLNAMLMESTDHVTKVVTVGVPTFSELIKRYREERVVELDYKPKSLEELGYRLNHLEKDLGQYLLTDFTIKQISDYLDRTYKNNAYIKHRGDLKKIFQWAMTKGLMEANPAADTLPKKEPKKKRKPLTKGQYDLIYEVADEWLQITMDFALVTLQCEGDIVQLNHSDIKDGYLYLVQAKTEKWGLSARLRIKIGSSLQSILDRSKALPPECPYIIHRQPIKRRKSVEKDHVAQVTGEYLSKAFKKVRDKVPGMLFLAPEERPTFHEIRALGGYLYEQRPNCDREFVQKLMGHTNQKMTSHYVDRHNQWTECTADLEI